MSERPTVDWLIDDYIYSVRADESPYAPELVAALAEHGYVIVHPDDAPIAPLSVIGRSATFAATFADGWNACRTFIFGATA